jgi:prepilin-type N-terminal cleavage/methylation domain-containing protein
MTSVALNRYEQSASQRPSGNRRGFSLVEVVIAMAVMAVALFAAASNILSLNQAHAAQREEASVQVIANQLIERIMGSNFSQLGQAISAASQADQNAWSWQRRATPLPAAIAIQFGQVSVAAGPSVAATPLTAPLNPPLGEYGTDPMYATTDLVQLGIEGQPSGISNLRVYLEYYSMNIMNDLQAYQTAAIANPATAMTQRTAWTAEVGNIFLTDPTQVAIPPYPTPSPGSFPPTVTSSAPYPASCLPTPYGGANIFFPESATGANNMSQINLLQPVVPTTSQNDAVLVRILIFWVSQAQGQRWHEVWVVRRN